MTTDTSLIHYIEWETSIYKNERGRQKGEEHRSAGLLGISASITGRLPR